MDIYVKLAVLSQEKDTDIYFYTIYEQMNTIMQLPV